MLRIMFLLSLGQASLSLSLRAAFLQLIVNTVLVKSLIVLVVERMSTEPLIMLDEASVEDSIVRDGELGTTDPKQGTDTGIGIAVADEEGSSPLFF